MEEEIIEKIELPKLYRIEENENGNYVKDDKRYELQSCREFVPAKDKTISDYGWIEFETEEKAIEYFGLTKIEEKKND